MIREFRPAIVLVVAMTLITGAIYPFAVTGLARVMFPYQAHGSLIERNGQVVGSALIGQVFAELKIFTAVPRRPLPPIRTTRARLCPFPTMQQIQAAQISDRPARHS
jgi:K+-transporting ATPase ATPase C chain